VRSGGCWADGGPGVKKCSSFERKQRLMSATTPTVLAPVELHERKCAFCPAFNRNVGTLPSVILGPFTRRNVRKSIHVHLTCAMWAPESFHDPETNEMGNFISAYSRSRGLKCTVCLTIGATVGCYVPTCQNVYHFCCLYGTPPPSLSLIDNNGQCTRHDAYYAAFCPAHAESAKDDVYMPRIKADAGLSSFWRDRADAIEAALEGNPGLGTD